MKGLLLIVSMAVLLSGCQTLGGLFKKQKESPASEQHQSTSANKPASHKQQGFAGSWVTTFKKSGKSRASVYNFRDKKGEFNATMDAYIKSHSGYSKNKVQPVTWYTSLNDKKIHTKLWDKSKKVFWGITWEVKKYDPNRGVLIVKQTIDGMKGKGSSVTLRKCGTSGTKSSFYRTMCHN